MFYHVRNPEITLPILMHEFKIFSHLEIHFPRGVEHLLALCRDCWTMLIFWNCKKLDGYWSQVGRMFWQLTDIDLGSDPARYLLHHSDLLRHRYKNHSLSKCGQSLYTSIMEAGITPYSLIMAVKSGGHLLHGIFHCCPEGNQGEVQREMVLLDSIHVFLRAHFYPHYRGLRSPFPFPFTNYFFLSLYFLSPFPYTFLKCPLTSESSMDWNMM